MRPSVVPALAGLAVLCGCGGASVVAVKPSAAVAVKTSTISTVVITSSQSARVLRYRGPALTASLGLHETGRAKNVAIELMPSAWPDSSVFGSPIRTFDAQVAGAGHFTAGGSTDDQGYPYGMSFCSLGGPSPILDGVLTSVWLPANSTTRLSWKVRLAAPPWPSDTPSLRWLVIVPGKTNDPDQSTRATVGPQSFAINGPTGVHIRMAAGHGSAAPRKGSTLRYRSVLRGRPVRLIGTTRPPVTDAHVRVAYRSTTDSRHGPIGTTTTGIRGRFSLSWRPRVDGTYTITAAIPHPTGHHLADHNCDLAVTVS